MRTIKFRGIDTMSGEMVYGDLVQQELTDGSITTAIVQTYATYDVNPETVGQFTGLYDKNGKEIYEGDIIQGEYNHKHLIRYTEDDARFTATLVEYVGNEFAERWNTGDVTQKWIDEFSKVAIGNIHDNPELIEKYLLNKTKSNGNVH